MDLGEALFGGFVVGDGGCGEVFREGGEAC